MAMRRTKDSAAERDARLLIKYGHCIRSNHDPTVRFPDVEIRFNTKTKRLEPIKEGEQYTDFSALAPTQNNHN